MRSIMHILAIIIFGSAFLYSSVLGTYFRHFLHKPEYNHDDFNYTSEENRNNALDSLNDSSEISNNASEFDEKSLESTPNTRASGSLRTEDSNITLDSSPSSEQNVTNTQGTQTEITLTEIFSNETNSTGSTVPQSSGHPFNSSSQTKQNIESTSSSTFTNSGGVDPSSTEDEEEGVVRGKPSSTASTNNTTSKPETIYQKALSLINDTYTLSILLPVTAGVLFACSIIITIATCKCLKRQCRRRRLRRKVLPDSVKNFRPSDRARLLAESSDEEF